MPARYRVARAPPSGSRGFSRGRRLPMLPAMLQTPTTLVTRRPVYDDRGGVFGYELLPFDGSAGQGTAATASRAVLHGVVSGLLDGLAPTGRLVLPVDAAVLDEEVAALLPAERIALKLAPGAGAEPQLVPVVAALRTRGALVILGGCGTGDADPPDALLEQVDVVAVDLAEPDRRPRVPTSGRLAALPLLAEGIEDPRRFELARSLGCRYFQGAAFVATAVASTAPPGFRAAHLALLQAVSRPEVDFAEVERATKQDVQLTDACLRYLNAAAFGWRHRIESLSHAFVLLGERGVRSWATLVVLAELAGDRPEQLAVGAAVRGRFCELLGARLGLAAAPIHLFTLGMFSLLDVLTGRPLQEALDGLALSPDVRAALLGQPGALRWLLDAVVAYEAGDPDALAVALEALDAADDGLLEHYLSAVDWSARLFDRCLPEP